MKIIFIFGQFLVIHLLWYIAQSNADPRRRSRVRSNTETGHIIITITRNTTCPILMTPSANGECVCKTLGFGQRPIVYWQQTNRAYFAYTQGPCSSGEWIVGNGKIYAACKKCSCQITPPVNDDDAEYLKPDRTFYVQNSEGTCYQTNTLAFCPKKQKMFLADDGTTCSCYELNQDGEPIYTENRTPQIETTTITTKTPVPPASCPFPSNIRNGMRVKTDDNKKRYLILDGKVSNVPTQDANRLLFRDKSVARRLDKCVFDQIPMGEDLKGVHLAFSSDKKKIFLVYNGMKRHICNQTIYNAYHFRWNNPEPRKIMGQPEKGDSICSIDPIQPPFE